MPTKPTDGSNWSSWGSFVDAFVRGATTVGKALLSATDGAAARSAIGAGTSSLAIGTTSSTAKAGDYAPTKSDVGLGNVDNTADTAKPVSALQLAALDAKASVSGSLRVAVWNGSVYQVNGVTVTSSNRPSGSYIEFQNGPDPAGITPSLGVVNGDSWKAST